MAVLQVIKGSCPGQVIEIRGERTVFGRHPSSQVVLDNAAVSRHHAQILHSHGSYYLEDLRSRNRTHLNGAEVQGRTELQERDEITVCDFVFRFYLGPPDALRDGDEATPQSSQSSSNRASEDLATISADGAPAVARTAAVVFDESDHSSIITTLNATSSSGLRLKVNPEVKLKAVLDISSSLGRLLDIDEVLTRILDDLFKIFPQADEGFVMLKDPETEKLAIRATKSRRRGQEEAVPVSMTIVRQAMQTGEAILSADASDDSRFDSSESLSNLRIRSMICAPLCTKFGDALGVIQVTTRDLRLQFSQDDLDLLASIASQGGLAIDNAHMHEALVKQRMLDKELEFATQVQLGFLPHERPKLPGYEFFDYYEPAQSVGGDYFDYVPLPDGRMAVCLADVAGKGVPAALLMARLYSSARFHLLTKSGVGEAMSGLNGEIAASGLGHRFITAVMAVIDPSTHTVTVANAGHLPPIRRRARSKAEEVTRSDSGLPLGILADQQFREVRFECRRGETWALYTDGVTEAMNAKREIYGSERLLAQVDAKSDSVEALVRGIIADVEEFSRGEAQRDDICLVAFRRTT